MMIGPWIMPDISGHQPTAIVSYWQILATMHPADGAWSMTCMCMPDEACCVPEQSKRYTLSKIDPVFFVDVAQACIAYIIDHP